MKDKTFKTEEKKKKPLWKTAVNGVIYIVIVAGIVLGLPRFLSWSLGTPYPMAAITSGSMWPALKEGDLVFIKGIEGKNELQVGDIIVYRSGSRGTFTIHRLVALQEDEFVTKGDANFSEDAPALYTSIVGKTLSFGDRPVHIPYLGAVTVFASNLRQQRNEGAE